MIAQAHSRKRLRERDYDVKLGGEARRSEATDRARFEALSVRHEIAAKLRGDE